ncbi:MAG: tyrosine-protein phosphatase [Myxococcota bacterium]|nr:tyrosine-protein phosphatase [bacterium]MDP6075829.1 tyrosine-protein phosphatase [Myxococcota bacterium]MDP7075117.1 tyrosine-protein phosphatase [Myxococcota bacterium]MDP7298733.1 tyrosine-protein phosphatase [Myxococcota bacterium]MDP7433947.1 tyrosine-protein phosphatase [Myxococcota bacterium]
MRLHFSALFLAGLLLACGADPYAGQPPHVEQRHVALDGAFNFRDLGGYPTRDGRSVRWGVLFRSDALAELSDADLAVLGELGLRLVCDFRSPEEKAEAPDRLPVDEPPEVAELEIAIEGVNIAELHERILSGDVEGIDLIGANLQFALRFAPQYAAMFERITRPENLPALIHCTGGKDRAGFGAALILRTLGVPLEAVYEDFLLTNVYTAERIERALWVIRFTSVFRADTEKVRALLGVRRENLEAAFGAIDRRWGSFDAYRREALGLDDAQVESFRNLVLETPGSGS